MSAVTQDLRNAAGLISIRTGSLGLATRTPVAADYLALWGPAVTNHLVGWLLYCADDAARMDDPDDWGACEHPHEVQRAHGLATALLEAERAHANA